MEGVPEGNQPKNMKERIGYFGEKVKGISSMVKETLKRAGEARNLGGRLQEEGNPYGLLLLSTPLLTGSQGELPTDIKDPVTFSLYGLGGWLASRGAAEASKSGEDKTSYNSSVGLSGAYGDAVVTNLIIANSSTNPVGYSLSFGSTELTRGLSKTQGELKFDDNADQRIIGGSTECVMGGALLASAASAASSPEWNRFLAQNLHSSVGNPYHSENSMGFTIPALGAASVSEVPVYHDLTPKVSEFGVSLGSLSTKALRYTGKEQFVLKSGDQEVAVVKSGQTMLILHVNQMVGAYAEMKSLERVRAIGKDFRKLCELINHPDQSGLPQDQQETLITFQAAPMIGVSHLVRLLGSKGLPTWGIGTLPKMLRRFHRLDSQLVSKAFGGNRQVQEKDIQVVFISPQARREIAA